MCEHYVGVGLYYFSFHSLLGSRFISHIRNRSNKMNYSIHIYDW